MVNPTTERNEPPLITLRAACILPIDAPPIYDGEVVIDRDKIVEVRKRPHSSGNAVDFGDAIIMPGFVNVHSHLELTLLRGLIGDLPFFPWIRKLVELKQKVSTNLWLDSSRLGAAETLAAGITTVGDCCDSGTAYQACEELGLRGIIFQEVFGIEEPLNTPKILASLSEKLAKYKQTPKLELGVSPHSVYTVRPTLMKELANYQSKLAIHAAESDAEVDFLLNGTGEFAEMYHRRSIPCEPVNSTPIAYLDNLGVLTLQTLLIHCTHVTPEDIALIARKGSAIAHCPKSNAKLSSGIAPITEFMNAGIRVGIGTDGAVSNDHIDMFEEMRQTIFAQRYKKVSIDAQTVIKMATIGGASSLGLEQKIGTLTPGKQADLCIISLDHRIPQPDPYSTLVYSSSASDVIFTMVAGEPFYESGQWLSNDVPAIKQRVMDVSRSLIS